VNAPPAVAPTQTPHERRAELVKGLAIGRIVHYRDLGGVDHAAIVVKVSDAALGLVNLVEFGIHPGDDPTHILHDIAFSEAPDTPRAWRWPEKK